MTSSPPRRRHPVGLFDSHAKTILTAAQRDGERRGASYLTSGLILAAAANANDDFADRLLRALNTNVEALNAAVDAEWSARATSLKDEPVTLLNESFHSVAAAALPEADLHLEALLANLLGYPDSMASRIVRRLGGDPIDVAARLSSEL